MDRIRPAKGLRSSSIAAIVVMIILALLGLGVAADRAPRVEPERYGGDVRMTADDPLVAIDPLAATYHRGQVFDVHVVITDVVDLTGYELHLAFDPTVVQVLDADPLTAGVNVAPGNFLPGSAALPNLADNVAGAIDLGVTKIGLPAVSGSGRLATITLEAIAPGTVDLGFVLVNLSDSNILPITHQTQDSGIIILDATPTDGPSPTPTATRTATPTLTPTNGPTPTNTPEPGPTPYFYTEPSVQELGIGDTTQVEVLTSYVDGLSGVQVFMSWDPALLAVVDQDPAVAGVQVTPGNLFEGYSTWALIYDVNNSTGEMYYAYFMTEEFCISGQWSVFTIEFESLREGIADIEFGDETMMACSGLNLPSGWIDGRIEIVSGPTSTPTATLDVTETPTPTETATATPTMVPTIAPPVISCNDIIENGDMENQSSTAWRMSGMADYTPDFAHSPDRSVWLGGYTSATDEMVQTVVIPADPLTATLGCWYFVQSISDAAPEDYLYLEVREAGEATVLFNLAIASDASTRNGWLYSEVDLLSVGGGQTVDLALRGETDSTENSYTSFFVDDVTFRVCAEENQTPTPTGSELHLPLVHKD